MGQCLVNLILKNGTYQKELFFGSSMQKKKPFQNCMNGCFFVSFEVHKPVQDLKNWRKYWNCGRRWKMFLFAYYYKVNIFTYILRIFYIIKPHKDLINSLSNFANLFSKVNMISLIDTKKFPGVTKRNVL